MLRDLFDVGTKLKENIFKSNNQISSTVVTRTWVLSTEWSRTWPSIGIQTKKWWWFPFAWKVDVVFQGVWILYRINKDEGDESLPLLAFLSQVVNVNFLKYSKEGKLCSRYLWIQNIPSDVCYYYTKHYQVQSEHRRIQNPFKHLRGNVLRKQLTAWSH